MGANNRVIETGLHPKREENYQEMIDELNEYIGQVKENNATIEWRKIDMIITVHKCNDREIIDDYQL